MPTNGSQPAALVKRLGDMVKIGSDPWKPYRKLNKAEKQYVDSFKRRK
jgi:Txe/YoeB family toxin of Txe-Axe toxin-antitoxin module